MLLTVGIADAITGGPTRCELSRRHSLNSPMLANKSKIPPILLRHHGMSEDSLRHVYKPVVLSKLLYASPSWWGFTSAADKQRLEASVRRAIRLGLYTADDSTLSQLAAVWDDNLFANILNNPHRVLQFCTNLSRTKLIIPTILDLVVTLSH